MTRLKNWFFARTPGTRAAITMGCGALTVIFVILLLIAIIAGIGWKLLWLIPIGLVGWVLFWTGRGIYLVWKLLTEEFERGDRSK